MKTVAMRRKTMSKKIKGARKISPEKSKEPFNSHPQDMLVAVLPNTNVQMPGSYEATLSIELIIEGPVISAATDAGAFGLDKSFAKSLSGKPYIPGSQIKGRLLEAISTLEADKVINISEEDINFLFGQKSDKEYEAEIQSAKKSNQPRRGTLTVSHFIAENKGGDGVRMRIAMDPDRGAVKKGAYMVIEAPFASGAEVKFSGKIRFVSQNPNMPEILEECFRWIPALGAQKSVGFGRIKNVEVTKEEITHLGQQCQAEDDLNQESVAIQVFSGDVLCIGLQPETSFCLAMPRTKDGNFFQAESVIGGNVIKGCMANTLNHLLGRPLDSPIDENLPAPWTELGKHFSRIRCLHAFPVSEKEQSKENDLMDSGNRPRRYPLSIVRVKDKTYDVALCPEPRLIYGMAPAFSIDWKGNDFKEVNKEFAWCDQLQKVPRVRTAINRDLRRAEEGKLFAQESIIPKGYTWNSRIYLSNISDETEKSQVRSALQKLFNYGLNYLGKTKSKVIVKMDVSLSDKFTEIVSGLEGGEYVVTLQTPALMLNPWGKHDDGKSLNDALVDSSILMDGYNGYWKDVSGAKFELVRFFARQKLLGRYLSYRFQSGKAYNPFLVTEGQSVFVLKPVNNQNDTNKILEKWLKNGLPLPSWAHQEYADPDNDGKASYRTCPFMPENGFGEVSVNMSCHEKLKPKPEPKPENSQEVGYACS
jgi:CRISPR/Cas system CSM-associated protein Csm3 (group 7 of RAMP superfamily)